MNKRTAITLTLAFVAGALCVSIYRYIILPIVYPYQEAITNAAKCTEYQWCYDPEIDPYEMDFPDKHNGFWLFIVMDEKGSEKSHWRLVSWIDEQDKKDALTFWNNASEYFCVYRDEQGKIEGDIRRHFGFTEREYVIRYQQLLSFEKSGEIKSPKKFPTCKDE